MLADPAVGAHIGVAAVPEGGASLNVGWRFYRGDIVPPPLLHHSHSYVAAKAGGARGAAGPSFNDAEWRVVDLPHDWAIETPPQKSENAAQGYPQHQPRSFVAGPLHRSAVRGDRDQRDSVVQRHAGCAQLVRL
jgi:hypothetical protein